MKRTTFILLLFIPFLLAAQRNFITPYEKSGYMETPRYAETLAYCQSLAKASPMIHYTTFGTSPLGRDLPLLIIDKNGNHTPERIRQSGNAVLMVQACIHAGEPDGKDAMLMLLRDMAIHKRYPHLLDNVSILFIPIFNADGHERFGPYNRINQNGPKEMGWRANSLNQNLNRDYLKADAPEMQAWLQLYNRWLPEFFIDCHTTDGADYQYPLTYSLESGANLHTDVARWVKHTAEPYLTKEMEKNDMPVFPYVEFRNWHDPRSGLTHSPAQAMLSHGYTLLHNRPSLLIETHMLKPYKVRVDATYQMILHTLELLHKEHGTLMKHIADADRYTASEAFRRQPFPLSFGLSETDSTMVDFLGVEYTKETSSLTGGDWFKYDNTRPVTFKLPFFNVPVPQNEVLLPDAYLIPPQYADVIDRLQWHGVEMRPVQSDTTVQAEMSRFVNPRWAQRPYEGRHKVSYTLQTVQEQRTFPRGTMLVPMNQPNAKLIANALEPACPESFAAWGFFTGVMEQKEYTETYVMETMAREMLRDNPALKAELERKKTEDPAFAAQPYAILNWFYAKTPYWDKAYNLYPIGRLRF